LINFDLIKHRRIIAVNNAYGDPVLDGNGHAKKDRSDQLVYVPRDWVDAVWFVDARWFSWHVKNLKDFSGIISHCAPRCIHIGMNYFLRGKPGGIESREQYIAWNGNAGMSAINFAYHLGVKRVVLLGYDMQRVNGQPNWHKDHPAPQKNPYFRFLRKAPNIKADAARLGLEIVNCTPGSALTQWPIMSLEEYLVQEQTLDTQGGN
jgi:hypothetical protein